MNLSNKSSGTWVLGFGIFASLLLISWFNDIKLSKSYIKIPLIIFLILAYIFNYSTQFFELTRFLEQETGQRTALVKKDEPLVNFWKLTKPDCILVSDPQTQLVIHSVGEGITPRGMYMTLDSRKKLAEFVREPSQTNLIRVVEIEELKEIETKKICIGISQRLIEMAHKNRTWESLISTYQVDHRNNYLEINHDVIELLDTYPRIYFDDYHAIFLVRNPD